MALGIEPQAYARVASLTFLEGDAQAAYAALADGRGLIANGIFAAQAGLTENEVSGICRLYAERGMAGLVSGPRDPAAGTGRFLSAQQEAEICALICRHTPDELGLPSALWSRAAVRATSAYDSETGLPCSRVSSGASSPAAVSTASAAASSAAIFGPAASASDDQPALSRILA